MATYAKYLLFCCLALGNFRAVAVDGGDILDDMLGAAPTVAPVATVAPVTPTPAAIISPNKPQCAVDLIGVLICACLMAQVITYSTADCAQPGQVSSVCASDVASLVSQTAGMSGIFSDAVFSCGNIDGSCPQTISNAISETADATNSIIEMEDTCFDRFYCTCQVFSFMSSAIRAAKNIETAVFQCKPSDDGDGDDGDDGDAGDGDDGDGDAGSDGDGDGDGDGSAASNQAPPDLTPEQVAQLYPNGAPTGSGGRRLTKSAALLRGGVAPSSHISFSRSVLPPTAHGLE